MDISRQSMAKIEDLMAMDIESYRLLILSKIENRSLLAEFVNSLESDTKIWDYAVAAGLLTRDEVKWIKEEEAGGGDDDKVVIFQKTGSDASVFADNSSVKTAKDLWDAITADPNIMVKFVDDRLDLEMTLKANDEHRKTWSNGDYYAASYHNDEGEEYTVSVWVDYGD